MGTRAGDLDPGIFTHLLREWHSLHDLERVLHRESGRQALAGAADMRELLSRRDAEAELALDISCYRVRKGVGAYLAALEPLAWAGVRLDPDRNARNELRITVADASLPAYVIPTDEERLIAREVVATL